MSTRMGLVKPQSHGLSTSSSRRTAKAARAFERQQHDEEEPLLLRRVAALPARTASDAPHPQPSWIQRRKASKLLRKRIKNRFFAGLGLGIALLLVCATVFRSRLFLARDVAAAGPQLLSGGGGECHWGIEKDFPALAFALQFLVVLYMFIGLAIVCDEYFLASLEEISVRLKLSEDVAGATFMAAASSAPELFTNLVDTAFDKGGNIGVGTIVGSAMFNILVIVAAAGAFSSGVSVDWRPLMRDSAFYLVSIGTILVFFADGDVEWWESFIMLLFYGAYILWMRYNTEINDAWCPGSSLAPRTVPDLVRQATGLGPDGGADPDMKVVEVDIVPLQRRSTRAGGRRGSFVVGHGQAFHAQRELVSRGSSRSLDLGAMRQASSRSLTDGVGVHGSAAPSTGGGRARGVSQSGVDGSRDRLSLGAPPTVTEEPVTADGVATPSASAQKKMDAQPLAAAATASVAPDVQEKEKKAEKTKQDARPPQPSEASKPSKPAAAADDDDDAEATVLDVGQTTVVSGGYTDEEDEEDSALDRFISFISIPMSKIVGLGIPDCAEEENKHKFIVTFVMSIVYIGLLSFVMVEAASRMGCLIGVRPVLMGVTVLAIGTSVPDALGSVVAARQGMGSMAVSNAIGSNVFDILIGLGLPWVFKSWITGNPIAVLVDDLTVPVVILFVTVFFVIFVLWLSSWKLTQRVGASLLSIYVGFIVYSIAQE